MEAGQRCPVVFMYYIILAVLIAADQLIKILVRNTKEIGESIPIFGDIFKLTYIENEGMAFGMMAGKSMFLTVVPIIFLVIIFVLWKKYGHKYTSLVDISVTMVLAGGISNIFDRICFGSVTDYLNLKGFAIFNFADICATVGCVLLCIGICFFEKRNNYE